MYYTNLKTIYTKVTPILMILGFLFIVINIDWVFVDQTSRDGHDYNGNPNKHNVNCNELMVQDSVNPPSVTARPDNLDRFDFELGHFRFRKQFGDTYYFYQKYEDNSCAVYINQRYFNFDELKFLLVLYFTFSVLWFYLIKRNLIELSFILLILAFPLAIFLDILVFGIQISLM